METAETLETPLETEDSTRVVVTTLNSRWIIIGDRFMREPLRGPRDPLYTIDGSGQDDVWHEHQGVWLGTNALGKKYVRVLPAGRPATFFGLVSSQITDFEAEAI